MFNKFAEKLVDILSYIGIPLKLGEGGGLQYMYVYYTHRIRIKTEKKAKVVAAV